MGCAGGSAGFLLLTWWPQRLAFRPDPLLYGLLQFSCGVLAFTFVASALGRFRGTRDRSTLAVAFGIALSGIFITSASVGFLRHAEFEGNEIQTVPLAWWMNRTLLGVVILLALTMDRRVPPVRHPGREIAIMLFLAVLCAYFTDPIYDNMRISRIVFPRAVFPAPLNILTAAGFLWAAMGFRYRFRKSGNELDRSLCAAMALNAGCHLAAAKSGQMYDHAFAASQFLMAASYAVALGGALAENARVFDKVHQLASSDALTGLGNYRRLLEVLDTEVMRSGRTGRAFAVVLLDLDGLKHINDRYGHLVGSQALCRLAAVMSRNCRSIDTAARYGGDEFALVLPETGQAAAREVAARICERLAMDAHGPRLSVSVGVAIFPQGGAQIDELLTRADEALYAMKSRRKNRTPGAPPTASGWLFEQ
jgi:diguanylate cyclase (GGDEF)-like protein